MGRPERPLDSLHDPLGEFADDLRTLRRSAGNPSYRKLARSALFAPSVLSSAASGHRLPSLPVTLAFVAACGGEPAVWEQRWRELAAIQGTAAQNTATASTAAQSAAARSVVAHDRAGSAQPGGVPARPAQLPMGSDTFVGRAEALADAARLVAPDGAVTSALLVSGPIGIGKTAFALRLADDLAGAFPDGQLYADLGGAGAGTPSAIAVVQGFLHALGVDAAHVPEDATQRIGLIRSLLAQRRLFVLLDDAQDERQVRPLLGRATSSLVVVTGRARLLGLDGVRRIDLDPFSRAESLTLIGRLAGDERIRAEQEAAGIVAELCDHLPLAISVVGRRIAARPEWTVSAVAGLLADAERLMAGLSVGDVKVRDIFAVAYRRLTPAARHALHQLAATGPAPVGGGPAGARTAAGLAALLGVAAGTADELLESLVDSGLVTRADGTGHYGVSTLVRAFAVSTPHAARTSAAPQARPDGVVGRKMSLARSNRLPPLRAGTAESRPARGDVLA
ncbi:NB-ARC domain-containing protein [Dactylosporangium sp. NPDC005572]|uniref:NB-ARC domain-containing protein n=1 Tax=Dactylosporangium sp. NPDC005572 TaxID=3156889 RepID=UPI0033B338AA